MRPQGGWMVDGQPAAMDPVAVIRSRPYHLALVLAALLGIPISAVAYGFLALVGKIQEYLFTDLPQDVLTGDTPAWWPVPWLVLCGVLTGLTIQYLPGNAGHSPAFGFKAGEHTAEHQPGHRPPGRRCRAADHVGREVGEDERLDPGHQ